MFDRIVKALKTYTRRVPIYAHSRNETCMTAQGDMLAAFFTPAAKRSSDLLQ